MKHEMHAVLGWPENDEEAGVPASLASTHGQRSRQLAWHATDRSAPNFRLVFRLLRLLRFLREVELNTGPTHRRSLRAYAIAPLSPVAQKGRRSLRAYTRGQLPPAFSVSVDCSHVDSARRRISVCYSWTDMIPELTHARNQLRPDVHSSRQ